MAQTIISDALTPELINQLAQVLSQLASPDNSVRSAAEQQLNQQLLGQPDLLLSALAHVTRQHSDQHLRSFSAILLRRLALKQAPNGPKDQNITYYIWIGEGSRAYIQNELLQSLNAEQQAAVRRKVADTIAELAKHMLQKGSTWNDLLHAIFECARSPAADHRISAFQILAQVSGLVTDTDVNSMKRFFGSALQDATAEVRLESLNASVQYAIELEPAKMKVFSDFIPQMLSVLATLKKQEELLDKALGHVIELAEIYPKLLRNVLPQLIQFTCQLMKDEELDVATRQSALEIMMTLAENAPGLVRKNPQFCQSIIPILMDWMGNLDEDEGWFTTDDLEDEDGDADDIIGGEALDRLARALGGKAVLPVAFTLIPAMLASDDWRKRHGAMMTISAIAEGCAKIMEAELGRILDLIVSHLRDPHPRVQWATCNAIGQMSTDFAPVMQNKFADIVLSNLVTVLDYRDFPRVQAHAAAALVNFCQEVNKESIAPYLPAIFEKLLILLNTGKTYVQEQAITTIATVADSAGDNFVKYYSAIMPFLLNILRQATQKEFRLLRGKAMECASLIALAVGKEVFAPNAAELIEILRQTQESITEADDPQSSYLLAAWARLCKVLEADFVPYLQFVLPPLLHSAQLKPDFALIDADEDEDTVRDKYDEDWELLVVDGQRVGIRTTVLEEKCTAVEMLICYARELGAGFAPFVKEVMAIVVPQLKFYFHEGVRHAAAATIPLLFSSVIKAQYSREQFDVYAVWQEVFAKTIDAAKDEMDPTFLAQLYTTTQECLDVLGPNSTPENLREDFITATTSQLDDYFNRLSEREASRRDDDYDAEDEDVLQNEEENDDLFLAELSTALHQFVKHHREGFLPQFDRLAPYVHRFITSKQPAARQWAICVFDDVIEFTGPASTRYQAQFWEHIMASVVDSSAEVRQAAAYGVGVAAQYGGPSYLQACASALPNLFAMINAPGSKSHENVLATENAISAVGKVCHFMGQSGAFDLDQILSAWVAALPIVEDSDEAPHTYTYLMELLQQHNPAVLGPNNSNVPKIALIFAEVLSSPDLLEEKKQLVEQIVGAMRQLMSSCGEDVRGQLWNSLSPEKRKVLVDKGYV